MKNYNIITQENCFTVLEELEEAFFDIPFENSNFQNEVFVIAAQITPERAYRAIGLRMFDKLKALKHAKFSTMKTAVDLEEIDYKLANENLNQFDRKREEIKKQEILSELGFNNKLINDAITELNFLYKHFKSLPKYTRDEFEAAEKLHFEQKIERQLLGIGGAKESAINMNEDLQSLSTVEKLVLNDATTVKELSKIVASLPNILKMDKSQK